MLKQLRLVFIGLFFGLFVIACGGETDDAATATDDNTTNDTAVVPEDDATVEDNAEAASEGSADSANQSGITSGMTEDEVISKLGEPDIKETYSIDKLEVGQYEWHSDEGITSVQLHNGEVTYSRFIPDSE